MVGSTPMSSVSVGMDSSPDPLGMSQDSSSPVKPKASRTPPRKALSTATGNAQTHSLEITTPQLPNVRIASPDKDGRIKENDPSPWQIRITVQAEQNNAPDGRHLSRCSPSKQFAEKTFTTVVPLKAGDDSSPVRRKPKGTPRKSRISPSARVSVSRSPVRSRGKTGVNKPAEVSASKPSSSPKKGRGRPRKSLDSAGATSPSSQSSTRRTSQRLASVDGDGGNQSTHGARRCPSNDSTHERAVSSDVEDEHREFDSILESEGFSMVSVSSLPSVQGSSKIAADSGCVLGGSPRSPSNRHITPAAGDSPLPPFPPQPAAAQQSTRELNKPTSGTPRLVRVVRAGIALQGVLSPSRQQRTSESLAPWANHSSPLSFAASPKERLDELFSGFGPGTRRELRAGLRLGEELAKRQKPNPQSASQKNDVDVFAPDSDVRYPQLPIASHYTLKVPDSTMSKSPSGFNAQLPSPARSDADADDDRMSWKYDTVQSNTAQAKLGNLSTMDPTYPEPSPVNRTLLEKEAEYQRDREATSKQIQNANSSQVIIVNSDDEHESSHESDLEDDGDIWQEEARSSNAHQSASDIPPIFLQNESRKPRRSQLPSPWMRKSHDVLNSSPAPNDSDLFWQPRQAEVSAGKAKMQRSTIQSKTLELSMVCGSSFSLDGVSDGVDEDLVTRDSQSALQSSVGPRTDETEEISDQQREWTILDQSLDGIDSDGSSYEAQNDDNSVNDDEDLESTLLSHHFMQEDTSSPLDEGTGIVTTDASISTTGFVEEDVPQPRTPSCLARTPRTASSKKVVRFTADTSDPPPTIVAAPPPAPLPPAPSSWFGRVTSLLPTWASSAPAAAAVPLPSPKPKKIINLSAVDVGPLPSYMPWTSCHWWALIHVTRQLSANPSLHPYSATSMAAQWLGTVVSVNRWSKTITKMDCAVVERFMRVLQLRGTFKGLEDKVMEGGKMQWGRLPGEWIDRRTVVSAVVAQWAVDVQDGVAEVGWGDRVGLKAGTGMVWTSRDREVDGGGVVYVL